ncbi:DUF934 domain-containing protein [Methylomonas sp. EFPC3]|uniref:DUF934 domain-containing protein n=1 Tax=Methylomonas TaxID=416 RepID=UPI00112EBA6B|nr:MULTISPECIES: DUF934 domain-containing protein [Methylomonas]TPQ24511.1 oxidoreductase [Methylomonas koyamae]WFP49032.1 DUF934 domain-containing protein [Methylomonas sp. EFPC3]
MQIIKDQQLINNTWTFIEDAAPLPSGDITVSLQRWLSEKAQLLERNSKVGIRVAPGEQLDALNSDLDKIDLIELNFPIFGDGRLFSVARLLRSRDGYQGELRAVGQYLPDQVFYLSRVGINAFDLSSQNDADLVLAAMNQFSVRYQSSTN